MTKRKTKPEPTLEEQLAKAQTDNLRFCEKWGGQMPHVDGIMLCKAFTYDLVQHLNRASFQGLTSEQ
jgi:hypothetical protein